MSEIRYHHNSSTLSATGLVLTSIISMQLLFSSIPDNTLAKDEKITFPNCYTNGGNPATYDRFSPIFIPELNIITAHAFEDAVSGFYFTLLSKQEELGAEFEKILYDNLWDLYER